MKIPLSLWFALAVAAAGPAMAQTPATSPADTGCEHCHEKMAAAKRSETEEAIIQLEQKWCDAEAAHDVAFLEKVEADTFTFTDSAGRLTTKRDEIASAKEGGDKIEFRLSDMKAQIYGDTVVLTGQTTFDTADTDATPAAYRWTDVFVRQANGEWQVVASQATAVGQSGKIAGSGATP